MLMTFLQDLDTKDQTLVIDTQVLSETEMSFATCNVIRLSFRQPERNAEKKTWSEILEGRAN